MPKDEYFFNIHHYSKLIKQQSFGSGLIGSLSHGQMDPVSFLWRLEKREGTIFFPERFLKENQRVLVLQGFQTSLWL